MSAITTLLVTTHKKNQIHDARYDTIGLDLGHYANKDEFLRACAALHFDEDNPEFVFLESPLPSCLVQEDDVSSSIWDMLDDTTYRGVLDAAIAFVDCQGYWDSAEFNDAYIGEFASLEEYALNYLEDNGILDKVPECLRNHIDIESFARDFVFHSDMYCCDTPDRSAKFLFNGNY